LLVDGRMREAPKLTDPDLDPLLNFQGDQLTIFSVGFQKIAEDACSLFHVAKCMVRKTAKDGKVFSSFSVYFHKTIYV
jgi:hypothetical protein